MASKPLRPCKHYGCPALVESGYCEQHSKDATRDDHKASANKRGYTSKWAKYSKWFLKQPGNQLCKLRLQGCNIISQCIDHIQPPSGPDDPLFWLRTNHQAACIRCNSVKGHKTLKGDAPTKI